MSGNYPNNRGNAPARNPRKKSMLNDWRLPHPSSDEPVDGAKYPAQLMWEITNSKSQAIVLKVDDKVFKEGGNQHKEVELDWADRGQLFEALLEACNNPHFTRADVPIRRKDFVRMNGQTRMSDQAILKVTFVVVRTKDGEIKLGWAKGDYKVTFTFKGPRETKAIAQIRMPDGTTVEDKGLGSRSSVRTWIRFFQPILDDHERNAWEPHQPKENNDGNNNRGSNNSNSYNGGQKDNYSSSDDDDEIDF